MIVQKGERKKVSGKGLTFASKYGIIYKHRERAVRRKHIEKREEPRKNG